MSTLMMMCGAVVGGGLFLLVRTRVPARLDPVVAVGRYDAARAAAARSEPDSGGWNRALAHWLFARGYSPRGAKADLAVTGQSVESFVAAKATLGLAGLVLPLVFSLAWALVGIRLPVEVPAVLCLGCAAGFFFLPDVALRKKATAARGELRRTLGSYLDLVSLGLAGGRGLAEALSIAAQVGEGWTFRLLADTADRARPLGISPWQALAQLGERLRIPELVDLGATLNLAGNEGAQVRASLAARAATLRGRILADATGKAAADDQSMGIAQVILGLGFLLFITYPAVFQVLSTN
jgi:Flp pilus assembly protein TadB